MSDLQIVNTKQIQAKGRGHQVTRTGLGAYQVVSGASGSLYHVHVIEKGHYGCTCSWGQSRGHGEPCACSHVQAVIMWVAEKVGRRASFWGSEEEARRQRRKMVNIGDGVWLTVR